VSAPRARRKDARAVGGRGRASRPAGRAVASRPRPGEVRLERALEAVGMALWEMDAKTEAMWWSEPAARLLGVASAAAAPMRLSAALQLIHPDDRPPLRDAVARAIARPGEAQTVQARVAGEGGTRWLEVRGLAHPDVAGRRVGLFGSFVDVTERKRVEEGLRRKLDEHRVLATVAEAAITSPDEETLLARVTAVLRDAFFPDNCGFLLLDEERERLVYSRSYHFRRPPPEPGEVRVGEGVVGRVARTGSPRRVDDTRRDPDYVEEDPAVRSEICVPLKVDDRVLGVFDAESTSLAAYTADDERLLTVLASQVATALDRLRSAEALRESGELYRTYFTGSPLAMFVSDLAGRYLDVNGAACALTGYARDELLTKSVPGLLVPEDAERNGERLLSLLRLGSGQHTVRILHRDGSVRHCLIHGSVIGDDRLFGLLLDVTDREETEARLRDSEDRFRSLSEAAFEAIFVHDGGRIVDVNQALCDLTGHSWHELVGRDGFDLAAPEYRETLQRNMRAEYERGYEIECLRRDGTRLPVEVQARSFLYRGQVRRVVAIRDVSDRRKAEAVRASLIRELEAKNAELERFGQAVTHDLKAPLVTVRGFADYLERDVREGRVEQAVVDAARVKEAVGRLQERLDELVELSHAARALGPKAAVPADEIVNEARRVLGDRGAREARVEVKGPLPLLYGDRTRLVQALRCLLENALRQAKGGGPGVVRVEGHGTGREETTLVLRYATGSGEGEGSATGLAVARRIVDSHGGRLRVESEKPGSGALFLTLPGPPEAPGGRPAPAREGAERLRE
jgi:PAS domain S-box-containing protein